jgi:hypothetical protein
LSATFTSSQRHCPNYRNALRKHLRNRGGREFRTRCHIVVSTFIEHRKFFCWLTRSGGGRSEKKWKNRLTDRLFHGIL